MAMSDCIKCWDTPCTCGYDKYAEYKKYEVARHSDSLEYYVVDLVNEDLVIKI